MIILVRHGEATHHTQRLTGGWTDSQLTEKGRAQIKAAAVKLAKDFAGRLICCGVAAQIGFQSALNIAVATQLLPNTGQPLPFFSYGLTSLVSAYISMGVVLNVSLQRNVERDDEIFADDFRG